MILNYFFREKNLLISTVVHIGLGLLSSISPWPIIIWFYALFLFSVVQALYSISRKNSFGFILFAFYFAALEFIGRLALATPYLPEELGKYFLSGLFLTAIFLRGRPNKLGLLLVILLLPALLYDFSGKVSFGDIVFNFLGPFSLSLGVVIFNSKSISREQNDLLLRAIWLSCLTGLAFVLIKTPDYTNLEFTLASQSETSGGHASNQVSTVFGLGMFLTFYSIFNKLRFSGSMFTDFIVLIFFTLQGLLTFSRGGMIVGGISMLLLFIYRNFELIRRNFASLVFYSLVIGGGIFGVLKFANDLTGGLLLLRYQGETRGTLVGSKEKTVDVFFTNRLSIFEDDFLLWKNNPILGVGVGASQYLRNNYKDVRPHIEFSRLMAEHGLPGILFFLILIYIFMTRFMQERDWDNKLLILIFFLFSIATTFHAAMRTFVSPVMFVLVCMRHVDKSFNVQASKLRK